MQGKKLEYELYIDRAMIENEFDTLWAKQAAFNPTLFNDAARDDLKDTLLHQRPLKPVKAGRCTLLPEEERAPLALPMVQRFRMLQEVNNLRILHDNLKDEPLTLHQRDTLIEALECKSKITFVQIKKLLQLGGAVEFNLEDAKRPELKGNTTSAILGDKKHFGAMWFTFNEAQQDSIVQQLLREENEGKLIRWLQDETGIDEARADTIARAGLPEGYGSFSVKALARIVPELRRDVITYDKAVIAAGFDHHSNLNPSATGEILPELPYYGIPLQRHVAFGSGNPQDNEEKRFGKIANPTVHIGLNQVRKVVNAIIQRYGHPAEVIVEVARDLKQSAKQREDDHKQQTENQKRNDRLRADAAAILQTSPEQIRHADIQKLILWEELSRDPIERRCPYSGMHISAEMVLTDAVEVEHILPFSQTLDDSLNNKTVAMRLANRIKGNRTPWQARADFALQGWDYAGILNRSAQMPKAKRYRFAEDGYQKWLQDDKGFLPRALNDTRYLSRVAFEYLQLICPNTRVIPGRMTAMLRAKFGLNDVLGLQGEKNRNDHRHHAVDACVIGITDQGMLQRFANASASAREHQLNRLVDSMPYPWGTDHGREYFNSVKRAIDAIWVSHKPDHGYEGAMMEATAYGITKDGSIKQKKNEDGSEKAREIKNVIRISEPTQPLRHGVDKDGKPLPYIGYKGGSNHCIEIVRNEKGKWEGEVISTFEAYQMVRKHGAEHLRHPTLSQSGKPLVMRLIRGDFVRLIDDAGKIRTLRLCTVNAKGQMAFADTNEANVADRAVDKKLPNGTIRKKEIAYILKNAGPLREMKARRVTISPIGELRDNGFKE
jgi:CRISPR-associated endonuclease Csn1